MLLFGCWCLIVVFFVVAADVVIAQKHRWRQHHQRPSPSHLIPGPNRRSIQPCLCCPPCDGWWTRRPVLYCVDEPKWVRWSTMMGGEQRCKCSGQTDRRKPSQVLDQTDHDWMNFPKWWVETADKACKRWSFSPQASSPCICSCCGVVQLCKNPAKNELKSVRCKNMN